MEYNEIVFKSERGHPFTPKSKKKDKVKMAIYHCSTKPITRSSGRSATASIAYRAGVVIEDQRQEKTFDYSKRSGVLHSELICPNDLKISRSKLWNLAETTETRKNSRTAREFVVNIPHELIQNDISKGIALIREFSNQFKNDYGVAVDFAIHAPDQEGDNRNYHAHILLTTRKLERLESGKIALTTKSDLEQSNTQLKAQGKRSNQDELKYIREKWATITNQHLQKAGVDARIDHRSHKDRGLEELPTVKMGWVATQLERKGIRTDVGDQNRLIKKYNDTLQTKRELETLYRVNLAQGLYTRSQKQLDTATKPKNHTEPPKNQESVLNRKLEPSSAISQSNSTVNKQKAIQLFDKQIFALAEKIHSQQLENLKEKMIEYKELSRQLINQIELHKQNKPLNPFKLNAWTKELESLIKQHNNGIKEKYDLLKIDYERIKNNGVTHEHWQKANAQIYQNDKNTYLKIKEFKEEINKNTESSRAIGRRQNKER